MNTRANFPFVAATAGRRLSRPAMSMVDGHVFDFEGIASRTSIDVKSDSALRIGAGFRIRRVHHLIPIERHGDLIALDTQLQGVPVGAHAGKSYLLDGSIGGALIAPTGPALEFDELQYRAA